jgi:hypothetical protein
MTKRTKWTLIARPIPRLPTPPQLTFTGAPAASRAAHRAANAAFKASIGGIEAGSSPRSTAR